MKAHKSFVGSSIVFVGAVMMGCVGSLSGEVADSSRHVTTKVVTQREASDLALQYRQQAAGLREMARRVEWEAQWYAGQFGQNAEQAQRSRTMAQQLQATADEAEQQAREYQRQVPHGQVY